jgi:large subunit ribosomal protein L25
MVEVSTTIEAKKRTQFGKGTAHKLRAAGLVPAVAYGPGREPTPIAIDPHIFNLQRRQYARSQIFDVVVDGGDAFKALIKDIQYEPVRHSILHVDLYAVDMSKPIRVEVAIELVGKPAGAIEGGLLSQILRYVEVQCLPAKVPGAIQVDVSHLQIGQNVSTDTIELPEGVEITLRRPEPIATVVAPEAEEAPTLAEGLEAAEGEAAAPAKEGEATEGEETKEEEKKE